LNVEGDGQGDLAGHGGEHRAVMVYQIDAYRYWQAQLGRKDFSFGQFGENFTVDGLADDEVCIGDRYRIGSALFEVTQPRVTCYRVGIRMEEPAMAALLVSHHRPGFYFRVLEEGEVGAGDEIVKVADGPEHVTVADVDALLYLPNPSHEQLERSLRVPSLRPGMENVFKGNCRREDFGGRESRAQGRKRPATGLARFSGITSRRSRSRSCECGLIVHRTTGQGASARSSTRTVSRFTVAHHT
jgi:MOSC domain-containing protein YiiM